MSDDHIAPGANIDITATIYNAGGNTLTVQGRLLRWLSGEAV